MKEIGRYIVNEKGDILDSLSDPKKQFLITSDRLEEPDWIPFLKSIPNFNWNDFMPAYFDACKISGVKLVRWKINQEE